jgi:hypothetical protein
LLLKRLITANSESALDQEHEQHNYPVLIEEERRVFRFESYWVQLPNFVEVVQDSWARVVHSLDKVRAFHIKLSRLAKALKPWSKQHVMDLKLKAEITTEVVALLIRHRNIVLCPWLNYLSGRRHRHTSLGYRRCAESRSANGRDYSGSSLGTPAPGYSIFEQMLGGGKIPLPYSWCRTELLPAIVTRPHNCSTTILPYLAEELTD